jgi:hypothetical protein
MTRGTSVSGVARIHIVLGQQAFPAVQACLRVKGKTTVALQSVPPSVNAILLIY